MSNLIPSPRNYLTIGDKVRMKNGDILTIKSLEFTEFYAVEGGIFKKKDIETILTFNNE